jgi:hypothetical protein
VIAAVETVDGILDGEGGTATEADMEAAITGVEIICDETILAAADDCGTDGTELDS